MRKALMNQLSFSDAEFICKRKVTRSEKSFTEMEQAIPWKVFADLVEPHYPKLTIFPSSRWRVAASRRDDDPEPSPPPWSSTTSPPTPWKCRLHPLGFRGGHLVKVKQAPQPGPRAADSTAVRPQSVVTRLWIPAAVGG